MASQANIKTQTYFEYIGHNGQRVPRGHWTNRENHKKFMDWLRKKEGYYTMEDLYKIKRADVKKYGGGGLLYNYYNDTPVEFVTSMYPNYNWLLFRFSRTSKGYWENIENQKQFMDWLRKKEGYNTIEDLYKINTKVIKKYGGGGLLNWYYNDSFVKLLKALYPNYNWLIWKFYNVKRSFWKNKENHKKYMEWLKQELGYTNMEDLYKITLQDIENNYGAGVIALYYNYSPIEFVTSMYPNYNWIIWKFQKSPQGYWLSKENRKNYVYWLRQELGYTNMEDLYKITRRDFTNNYGDTLNNFYDHCIIKLLTDLYPNYNWDIGKFNYNKTEVIIHTFLVNNRSNIDIKKLVSQYKPDWSKNPDTGRCLPYDFYIELANGKKIIIECDGEQHYTENSHFHRNDRSLENQQDRDIFKMNKALENNVSIIRVHQEEVYNDTINWERELTDAINEIKNENEATIKLLGCLSDKVCWDLK